MEKKSVQEIALDAINASPNEDPFVDSHGPVGKIPALRVYLKDQGHPALTLVLVDVLKLDSMWANSALYLSNYEYAKPKDRWFLPFPESDDRYGIYAPTVGSFYAQTLEMMDGRHRTRWLIKNGFQQIIVAMDEGIIEAATAQGLVIRLARSDDKISPQ